MNHKMKKSLGQNFIKDINIIKKIVKLSGVNKNNTVIEIGAGSGSLTKELASSSKKVIAYEIDESLKDILRENLKDYINIEVIYEDFLKTNLKIKDKDIYVISNLPYYITTPIIVKLIKSNIDIKKIVIMVQKEVGKRFNAIPNTKDYSSITVFLNYYYNIRKLMDVNRNSFIPKPNVDSVVLELTRNDNKLKTNNEEIFFKLIKDSFQFKRKTLKNNLKNYNLKIIEEVLNKYNFNLNVRAEQLSLEVFIDISNKIKG